MLLRLEVLQIDKHRGAEQQGLVGFRGVLRKGDLELVSTKAELGAAVEDLPYLAGRATLGVSDIELDVAAAGAAQGELGDEARSESGFVGLAHF